MRDSLNPDELFIYGKNKHMFWVGVVDEEKISDKHYPDQVCYFPQLPTDMRKISLEDAIELDMVRPNRFNRMNESDRKDVMTIMFRRKGKYLTDEFLDKTKLKPTEKEALRQA